MAISKIENSSLASGVPSTANLPAGTVLQVVQGTTASPTSTSSSSYVATLITASITPTSATSKILITVNANVYISAVGAEAILTIYKNGSALTGSPDFADCYVGSSDLIAQAPMIYLDSPATTSSTTYTVYMKKYQGSGTIQTNLRGTTSTITLMEIAA